MLKNVTDCKRYKVFTDIKCIAFANFNYQTQYFEIAGHKVIGIGKKWCTLTNPLHSDRNVLFHGKLETSSMTYNNLYFRNGTKTSGLLVMFRAMLRCQAYFREAVIDHFWCSWIVMKWKTVLWIVIEVHSVKRKLPNSSNVYTYIEDQYWRN